MKFIYSDNRNTRQTKIIEAAIRNDWTISDIFIQDEDFASTYQTEAHRLQWAPILSALAFSESTAFHGFGARIADATDLATKSWLAAHLLDESKHTEGFSRLMDYLYPSYRNRQEKLFCSRDTLVFFGYTQRCEPLVEWLICTQVVEVFGRYCYKALHEKLAEEAVAQLFFQQIIKDEARHVAYISELINVNRAAIGEQEWHRRVKPFADKMIELGRKMFDGNKKAKVYRAFCAMDIDASAFCDTAVEDLQHRVA